jgi:hypothetical protein
MTGEAPDDAGLAAPVARDARLALGVVVERSRAATPWQEYVWLPVGVVVGSPLREPWAMMHEDPHATQFFAGEYEIELTPRETGNYQVNLAAEQPAVYVVLRFEDGAAPLGVRVQLVTVSPAEAQGYLEGGADVVEPVPMPESVAVWLSAYVAAYHVEEPFRKRQRRKLDPREIGFGRRDGGRA